ncbi:5-amino-6-(5-phosphoribosylamino)uracil reductase [Pigmentiphaga aceris]|uniref:5-amino-6-(5-phosphoribosylamino)uracil reductase n=1 Tax=Pigmentiphaga aceris TaxID=1940612 RepID=A0A5C0B0R7_9BURK|nr:dihydrofolate reductase family protein [Pigmentiphaga aceris]QEI06441.1 5-amino-6-(5-phosphoribosylamino)uracil reductase [Pigmentiphaga aceris]
MRPKIICHLVSSIDGRLLADRWVPTDTPSCVVTTSTRRARLGTRLDSDGFIVGSSSLAALPSVMAGSAKSGTRRVALGGKDTGQGDHYGARNGRKLAVVIDLDGTLHYDSDDADGHHIVTLLGDHVPETYLAELRAVGVSYLFAGPDGRNLADALAQLGEDFGVDTLLLEGGGRLNSTFMHAGLIDEISLLVCPVINDLPGGINTWEYTGTLDEQVVARRYLSHMATETLNGGMVWLRYAVLEPKASDVACTVYADDVFCDYSRC